MDDYLSEYDGFLAEAEAMFTDEYSDIKYTEDPQIEGLETYDEADYNASISSPIPLSEPLQSPLKDEEGFDALILDKAPKKGKKTAPEPPKTEEKKPEKKPEKEPKKEENELDDFLSDSELKEVNFSTTKASNDIDEDDDILPDSELKDVNFTTENPTIEEAFTDTKKKSTMNTGEPIITPAPEEKVEPDDIVYEQPYEEPFEIDVEKLEKENAYRSFFSNLKNVAIFAAMIFVLIGIPLLFSLLFRGSGKEKTEKAAVSKYTTETKTEAVTEVKKINIKLGEGLDTGKDFDEVHDKAYDSMSETNVSSRFETLDDLTYYLDSNMASTLALEKALATQYKNGSISRDYFTQEMNVEIEFTNTLNHLLTINKQTYKNEGKSDTYKRLSDDMDSLILYGDTLLYGGTESEEEMK